MKHSILVTGGAGFIGSNFVLDWRAQNRSAVVNLDRLTYAGNPDNLAPLAQDTEHLFVQGDINDRALLDQLFATHQPRAVVHFAAESHVDRSIAGPQDFIHTNINGTFQLLEAARHYWQGLPETDRADFRFLHVSTDEVYGSLAAHDPAFSETTAYAPNSPYAASKAASDHLVRAWHHTYGLPTLITNCSNNYGPRQFPEKLIPLMILNALQGKPLPIYGDGGNIRDWLYVGDHCAAIATVLAKGQPGETYNIGGHAERSNLQVAQAVCAVLDERHPQSCPTGHASLIRFVADRPGHDRRYAINADKIHRELGWRATQDFASGIRQTVAWYLDHPDWVQNVTTGQYRQWMAQQYRGQV